ncbi:MAG: hypothetical protein KGL39_09200 [Patescibacteria group bacterium]|nr:hypothetical protein [Patescibacteria group bacterium]
MSDSLIAKFGVMQVSVTFSGNWTALDEPDRTRLFQFVDGLKTLRDRCAGPADARGSNKGTNAR